MPDPSSPACSTCGVDVLAGARYCHMCGSSLTSASAGGRAVIERRVVSVLFADLEGFTAFSADRDPEDVREMLTQYFEVCRRVITRHGGMIEKFIGDAVMAVWGTPVAHEDDSVRAVKAALELVSLVSEIEVEPGLFLRIRGGVVTGEAAVTLGTVGQGMVAGDVVNTASRLQSNAPAGKVFVDDPTHALTELAILFSDGGSYALKGKPEPVHVWQAESVAPATHGIEAPFLGRDAEFATLLEGLRAVTDRRRQEGDMRPRWLSVVGGSGVGKSRLALEFARHIEDSSDDVRLVSGISAEFGGAGSFGALTQIVNGLLETGHDDPVEAVETKLRDILSDGVTDADDVDGVVRRVMALLRPGSGARFERGELFQAWQTLLQCFARLRPLVLVFEELQWAEAGLSEFLADLVDRSPTAPILILTLARPGAPAAGSAAAISAGQVATIDLAPLSSDTIAEMVGALVPELDIRMRRTIADQAEGIPLYAVETLRMLANQGVLGRDDNGYRLLGALDKIEIPQTVQLMVGVRLDALPAAERDLVQTAAVLGMSFPAAHLGVMEGVAAESLTPRLDVLVREEILKYDETDASGMRTFSFVQGLLREGAYSRLAKRERLKRHMAAARLLASASPEVVASHYLAAYRIDPANHDALSGARDTVVKAAESSESVGAVENAEQFYTLALEIAEDDPAMKASLAFQAGEMANYLAAWGRAREHYDSAKAFAERAGDAVLVANCWAQLARVAGNNGDATDALQLMRQAHASLPSTALPEVEGLILRRRADYEYISGDAPTAYGLAERSCELFAGLHSDEGMSGAMHTRAWPLGAMGRVDESLAYLAASQMLAERSGSLFEWWEALYREGWVRAEFGHLNELRDAAVRAQRVADRIGNRFSESCFATFITRTLYFLGEWDEALSVALQVADRVPEGEPSMSPFRYMAMIHSHRGDRETAATMVEHVPMAVDPGDADCAFYPMTLATIALDQEEYARVVDLMMPVLESQHNGGSPRNIEEAFAGISAATRATADWTTLERALAIAEAEWPARQIPSIKGQIALAQAFLTAQHGDMTTATAAFSTAIAHFRVSEQRYDVAMALADYSVWAAHHGLPHEAELAEARELLTALGARPNLDRLEEAFALQGAPSG